MSENPRVPLLMNPRVLVYISWFLLLGIAVLSYGGSKIALALFALSMILSSQILIQWLFPGRLMVRTRFWWILIFYTDFSGLLLGLGTLKGDSRMSLIGAALVVIHIVLSAKMIKSEPVFDTDQ